MKNESLKPMLDFITLILKTLINGNIPGVRAYMLYITVKAFNTAKFNVTIKIN